MSKINPENRTIAALRKRFTAAGNAADIEIGERKVQKNLRLPESAAKRLAAMAKAQGLSQAALIVEALTVYEAWRKRTLE